VISRVWRGRTSKDRADNYEAFLKETAYPDYGDVEGNRGWVLLRRTDGDAVEFMFVSFWDSMDALKRYAGEDSEQPKYYPEDKVARLELPERAEHYGGVDVQMK